jgi:protein-tyrosine-phosphatase/DNA-binding transcriptional ArsR family regulator
MLGEVSSAASMQDSAPPAFLRLAGHPVRWRLLRELARSDRQVRELTALLGARQSLVSYHLGQLRAGRLVRAHRSAADGRDAYYRLDLEHWGELLSGSGGALHPGLRLSAPVPVPVPAERRGRAAAAASVRVLFLCTGNSARSQMAEVLVERFAGGAVEARSAGSRPKPLHPNAVRAMRELGVDLAGRRSKHLDEFATERFDYVVSLCDRVREVCPEFPGHPELVHWSVPDPALEGEDDAATYPAFRRTAGELVTRVWFLLALIENLATTPEVT